MPWHQLSAITDEQTAAKLSDWFSNLGAVSVTYMDAEDQPIYEPKPGETKIWQLTRVIALFEMNINPEHIQSILFDTFTENQLQHWHHEVIQDQVWERAWMEHIKPMKFGHSLWVCPSNQEVEESGTTCLVLDPGLAFGTGTHSTTALCLEWLANQKLSGKTVIDYGCGSGILAVAASLLGAKDVYAVDIDEQALIATQQNAEKNQVQQRIQCFFPDPFKEHAIQADVVIANILALPLCEMAESLVEYVKPAGQIILSGILNEQANMVIDTYQQHNIVFDPLISDLDWCRLDGLKPALS